jgi:uncharacterized protein YndB with AHSA1/START domain
MTNATQTATTTQVYRVYIKATPEAIWDAITKPEWTDRYGYGGFPEYDLRPGAPYRVRAGSEMAAVEGVPEIVIDGEIVEADPPRKLVQTWRMLMDDDLAAEGFTKLTYEIQEIDGGYCKLTVAHDLTGAPRLANVVGGGIEAEGGGGGWAWALSDLKTLLETGSGFIPRG